MHKIQREMAKYCQGLGRSYPVILITGPRQSGKTTFAKQFYSSLPYVNLEDLQIRRIAVDDPKAFLSKYPSGAVFDEIQKAPDLTSYIQGIVDEDSFNGLFILTGSQNFSVLDTLSQSLAGRVATVQLLPFSLSEISHYTNIEDLNEILYRGFYPRISHRGLNPTNTYGDYVSTYLERDIRRFARLKNWDGFQRFLRMTAGRTGQLVNYSSLSNDVGVSVSTIQEWLTLLSAGYIIFRLQPFFENTGKRLLKQSKLYFYDVGLASYLIGITEKDQLKTHPLRGHLFENFVIVELLKQHFNQGKRTPFYFYRDSNHTEIDLLIPHSDKYNLFEIKSSKTLTSSFVKPFAQFQKAFEKMNHGAVIYAGTEQYSLKNIQMIPYTKLCRSKLL